MQTKEKRVFFNTSSSVFLYNKDLIIISLALLVMGTYLNGITAIFQAVVCVLSCCFSEYVFSKLVIKKNTLNDLSAVSTGLIIALLLPACAPLWVGAICGAFCISAVKIPFGGVRYSPFVPAACAICFANIFFPTQTGVFPAASCGFEAVFSSSEGFSAGTSLLELLKNGSSVDLGFPGVISLLSGSYPSSMGTSSLLALAGVAFYILIERPKRLVASSGYVLSAAVLAFLFPRVSSGRFESVALELAAGSLVFSALILKNDPVTSPKKSSSAFLYGAFAGAICMALRYFGKVIDPSCFSIIIANAAWPIFEKGLLSFEKKTERKKLFPAKKKREQVKENG